jgi:hypothetical protein
MADVEIAQAGTDAALYEADYAAWADRQASLARCGNVAALDLEHIAEELEALRGRERRELRQRLARLMQHLLKWAYQPERRCRSWATTLMIQRSDIHAILQDSPSLRPTLDDAIPPAFQRARAWAEEETGLLHLPPDCPWSTAQILDESFEPDVPPAGG